MPGKAFLSQFGFHRGQHVTVSTQLSGGLLGARKLRFACTAVAITLDAASRVTPAVRAASRSADSTATQ